MARKRVSRNEPCPCGSGKKYKKCCWGKGFEWEEDESGIIFKSTPLSPEMADILQDQRQKFIDKHGRVPGPDDPPFSDIPPLEHIEHQMVEAMKKAGINPAFIYASEKTGRIVTEENQHLLPESDLDEWQAAIEEYEANQRKKEPPQNPIGTVAMYGPNDKITTNNAAGVIVNDHAEPIMMRWVSTDVMTNPKVQREMQEFFRQHEVKSVARVDGNIGCPYEEGEDFPEGEDCPFCPFWKGNKGLPCWSETMAKPREPWNIRTAKKRASVTASLKTEVEKKATELIENVLKPKHVLPPPKANQGNYIIDIGAKWYRGYFYFFTIYACPGPNALSPTFEWTFARMEPLLNGTFALYAMRYTGKEWVGVLDALSVDECMKAIKDDEWFAM